MENFHIQNAVHFPNGLARKGHGNSVNLIVYYTI